MNTNISFLGILGLIFITLKLCGVINWSWWVALIPFYIVPVLVVLFCTIYLIIEVKKK